MITTLLVPGLDGSPAPHWQHWWAAGDPRALMVGLSEPSRPVAEVQEVELASMILQHPDCILVGHSLGAVLIARLLSRWPHLRVAGALLVAPAETEGRGRISSFGALPERPLDLPATVVASRNDPWMGFSRAAHLARVWQADLVDLGFAGHINTASGYGPWKAGKALRDALLRRARGGAAPGPLHPVRPYPVPSYAGPPYPVTGPGAGRGAALRVVS
ncbi:RBBP9/YdeN family alpha/beta hydrolase [Pseudogemmobacter faecipullorum]|uniref:Alpha/beta hydrolase n=1 Tax=Pseudogemmobacter faecipullorum TaxID=2755041 RepID=A0ABS8CIF4_9RHOB|nr:alpha/beta hydrolase [Pseudogemmobacter faecipullorum]MCB5409182.1 alpha/beta hydrolase [Pseudogemmobacter faecipullorum]